MPKTFVKNETSESTSLSLEKKKEPDTEGLIKSITVGNEVSVSHAIGIDLGTTYSRVGVFKNNQVEIIFDDQGNRTTPSCVAFFGEACLIGQSAKNYIANAVYDVKRLIGKRFNDANVTKGSNVEVKKFFAEEISSTLLMKLKEDAELYLGKTVKDAVISVPVSFDDSQRQATKDAGHVAGFDVVRLINDSTAAAIAYGLDMRSGITREKNVLIFDLGGGTFGVSLFTIDNKGMVKVKAVAGDDRLGGRDFDNNLLDHIVMEFNKTKKIDVREDFKALRRLRVACEKVKRVLSSNTRTYIELGCFHQGVGFIMKITREKFEDLNAELFSKCIETVDSCLTDAGTSKKDVDEVILVGGSTRIPKIQQLLQDFFDGKELCKRIHVDEAVAYGAAVLAAKLSGETTQKVKDLLLLDVVPLSTGTNLTDGTFDVIIPRHTPLPAKNERTYYTTEENQTSITVDIYQGEKSIAKQNYLLGKFTVEVPPAPKGISQVNVVFNIDANGILNCSGEEFTGGPNKNIIVRVDKQRLSIDEIKMMKKDIEKYKLDYHKYKKLFAFYALEDYIYDLEGKIETLDKKDRNKIEIAIEDAKRCLHGMKSRNTLTQLKKLCDPIIENLESTSLVYSGK